MKIAYIYKKDIKIEINKIIYVYNRSVNNNIK